MAGEFIDERIDPCARYGTSYEEGFEVSHITDIGGAEYSRIYSPYPRLRYELSFANGDREGLAKRITKLYQRCAGTFRYFRVKHYAEFTTNDRTKPPTPLDGPLLPIPNDTGEFLYRFVVLYDDPMTSSFFFFPRRIITKPVANTVRIAVNGLEVGPSVFYVDYTRGIVHFYSDPAGSVTGGCEFDIPMRFDANYSGTFNNLGVLSASVSLIEVLDADTQT